jgi:hypothetical protein
MVTPKQEKRVEQESDTSSDSDSEVVPECKYPRNTPNSLF